MNRLRKRLRLELLGLATIPLIFAVAIGGGAMHWLLELENKIDAKKQI
jgi:NhaP-type Na+/H+ or K+/H+ antiporter